MASDISNATIAVLLVLTIVVSVIGTWSVVNVVDDNMQLRQIVEQGPAKVGGKLSVKVFEPLHPAVSSGKVMVGITGNIPRA